MLYTSSHCLNDFFSSLPSELVCVISRGYTWCDFCCHDLLPSKKIYTCLDDTFLVPDTNHWRNSEKKWSWVLHKERFVCMLISRCIYLFFFQLQLLWTYLESLPVISRIWKFNVPIWAILILGTHLFSALDTTLGILQAYMYIFSS